MKNEKRKPADECTLAYRRKRVNIFFLNGKTEKYINLVRDLKQWNKNGDTNYCSAQNDPQMSGTGDGSAGTRKTSRDNPNYNIVEIGQNTEKRPEDIIRLAVT